MLFFGLGGIIGKVAGGIFGGGKAGGLLGGLLGGKGPLGGIFKGLQKLLSGDIFGAIKGALESFKGVTNGGGFGNLAGSKFPQAPGQIGQAAPFSKTGNSISGAAAGGAKGFTAQMKDVMNDKSLSPEQKKMKMLDIQEKKDLFDQMIQTLTAMQKRSHDTNMAVIRNLS